MSGENRNYSSFVDPMLFEDVASSLPQFDAVVLLPLFLGDNGVDISIFQREALELESLPHQAHSTDSRLSPANFSKHIAVLSGPK